jgi:LacI family transcriptional regulator
MATIYDIAREAAVSASTVSRALNGSRLVSDEVRERVSSVAGRLGYQKRTIRRHRDRMILSIKLVLPYLPDAERSLFWDVSQMVEGLRVGVEPCPVNLICEVARPDFTAFPHKKGGDTDAFVFAFHYPQEHILADVRQRGVPHMVVNRTLENIPGVIVDHHHGMNMLLDELAAGSDDLRICFVQLDDMGETAIERLAGLAEGCRARGIAFDAQRDVRSFPTTMQIDAAAVREMRQKSNVLCCVNDIVGLVVLTELERMGVSVPGEVQVTGFDDSPLRRLTRPLLTSVAMPVYELGRIAGASLQRQIVESTPPQAIIQVRGTLEVGESTLPARRGQ